MKKKRMFRYLLEKKRDRGSFLMMRLTIVLTILLSVNVFGSASSQTVKLKCENTSLREVFRLLKQQTGYLFMFNEEELDQKTRISMEVNETSLSKALDKILHGLPYTYETLERIVVIKPAVKNNAEPEKSERKITITGSVVDIKGVPLPGVSIILKGTNIGVTTNVNGEFTFVVFSVEDPVLILSFIGMKAKEVKCNGKSPVKVILEDDVEQLEEVVVTGLQEIPKSKMTGAVESISAADIANRGYSFVGEALKGTLPGVSIRNSSGRPGSNVEVRIRGINTLGTAKEPMWILDGMPFSGSLSDLNPDNIESITALKDAAATAIYGARAANGVMVIKTKRGREGRASLSISSNFSFDESPKRSVEMMNTEEKIAFERSIFEDFPNINLGGRVTQLLRNANIGKITRAEAEQGIEKLRKTQTNWDKELFRWAHSQSHSISLSGGNESSQFYSSINYRDIKGIEPCSDFKNGGISLNMSNDFNSWLKLGTSIMATYRKTAQSASGANIRSYAATANPYERLYNEDGSYAYDRSFSPELSTLKDGYKYDFNILEDYKRNKQTVTNLNISAGLDITVKLYKGLKFSTHGNVTYSASHVRKVLDPGSYTSKMNLWIASAYDGEAPDSANKGSMFEQTSKLESWNIRNELDYSLILNEKHVINLFVGQTVSGEKSNSFNMKMPEYDPRLGLVGYPNLAGIDGSKLKIDNLNGSSEDESRSVSFFGTASYAYNENRYVFSTSFRMDGVNVIDADNCYTPLWNISGRWNMHNEEFMKKLWFVSSLSLRASYGYTGNIDRNALPFSMFSFSNSQATYNGYNIPIEITPANPSVKWERKQDRSLGLDASLFNNRFNLTVNYYNNIVRDLLDTKQLPISTGQHSIRANVSTIQNIGWEVSFQLGLLQAKDFSWNISGNASYNRNKILDTYYEFGASAMRLGSMRVPIKGYSSDAWFGYRFAGVDPLTGNSLAYTNKTDASGSPYGHLGPDGRYLIDMDVEDKMVAMDYLGDGYPPLSGGFSTALRYKNISLNANFSYMARHMITSNYATMLGGALGQSQSNMPKTAKNRWRKPGDITDVPRYSMSATSWQNDTYDFKLEKGSYIKCNSISLGYGVSRNVCNKLNINSLRFTFNVHEVFTLSTYKCGDPENFAAFEYPNARKYMFTLSLNI